MCVKRRSSNLPHDIDLPMCIVYIHSEEHSRIFCWCVYMILPAACGIVLPELGIAAVGGKRHFENKSLPSPCGAYYSRTMWGTVAVSNHKNCRPAIGCGRCSPYFSCVVRSF